MSIECNRKLKKLIDEFDNRFEMNRNISSPLISTNDYVDTCFNTLDIFEKNYKIVSKLISEHNSNNFFTSENADKLLEILGELIPKFNEIKEMVVDPKFEDAHSKLIKALMEEIDRIMDICKYYCPPDTFNLTKEQIFKIAEIHYVQYHNFNFKTIKNTIKSIESRQILSNSFKSFGNNILTKIKKYILPFSFLIIFLLILFGPEHLKNNLLNLLEILGWGIVLLWIPFWFLRGLYVKNKPILRLVFIGIISILIPYFFKSGLITSLFLVGILIGFPMLMILTQSSKAVERYNNRARTLLFIPTLISLFLAFIITQEPLWLIGGIIWLTFTIMSRISYIYFRPSFDMLSKQDMNAEELIKDQWVFIGLFFVCIAISSGILSNITNTFLSSLYQSSSQIAITLVGILLAVQGVLSNMSLKSETKKDQILEATMILKIADGLKGFMIIFILLFILSLFGSFSSKESFNLNFNTTWLLNTINLSNIDLNSILVSLLFISFITVLSLSIGYLYYLFLSRNLILLPLKSRYMFKPVLIEENHSTYSETDDVVTELENTRELNGRIIKNLIINDTPDLFANITIEEMFPDKKDLMELSLKLGEIMIERKNFDRISIMVMSIQGSFGLMKVFQVNLDKDKLKFLNEDNGLDLEYKFTQLEAHIWSPAFKESHIL
ncbi:hypothetical protein [Methanobacterium sp. ACI-7]|uniref:hypothetical protein n=1 Tax=unclassified Methanobacterium TaxID=2627676 RepID=UPI0039C2C266